ncbi:MAG: efflux RND transporter periplasmic adaptor subunit [Rhodospirillaceae bacterium]|nr:efflux RND transporter periplasmic adaptor subunit [Rhodospirillaceae bacterium]
MHVDRGPSDQLLSTSQVPPRRQWRAVGLTAAVLAVIVAGFYGYQRMTSGMMRTFLSAPRPPITVEIAEAHVEAVPQLLSGIGTLQAVHQVTVSPEVGGRVVKVFFEPNAKVKAGDPLVQLYDAPLRADLANFEAQRQLATLNLQRAQELSARNIQSRQSFDQSQSTLAQANAGIAKAKAQIDQMLIKAPFDGELGVRQIEVGAYLTPGASIVTLTDPSTLWVNFTLPEQVANEVHTGQPARVRADAFPDRVFDAKITAIEPQISTQTRTLLVQATLPNPERALRSGMFARAEAVVLKELHAVVVPETAVDFSLYGESAFVIAETTDPSGKTVTKVNRVSVKTGQRFDGKVSVISGLSEGDRVVSAGQLKLNDGAVVTIAGNSPLTTPPSTSRY